MPLPRRRDTGGDAPRSTESGHYPTGPQVSSHSVTDAEPGHRGHRSRIWVERRNGMPPLVPYVYQPGGPATSDGGNCRTCELWTGCGGLFCRDPLQRRSTDGAR